MALILAERLPLKVQPDWSPHASTIVFGEVMGGWDRTTKIFLGFTSEVDPPWGPCFALWCAHPRGLVRRPFDVVFTSIQLEFAPDRVQVANDELADRDAFELEGHGTEEYHENVVRILE